MSELAPSPHLTYRLHRDEDISGLLRLWEENTGWGQLTAERWREWYVDTPHGPCLIPVAVDETGSIRGQLVLTPARLAVGDHELKVLRISAPILLKQFRQMQRPHPILCLYEVAVEAARAQGYCLVYAFPDQSLATFFRHLTNIRLSELECMARRADSDGPPPRPELSVAPAIKFGAEYQDLWDDSQRAFPIALGIKRSPEWVRYRNGGRLALEVRRPDRSLLGYTCFDTKTELLTDCLARTSGELIDVLSAAIHWRKNQINAPKAVKAMASPMMRPALHESGFISEHFTFLFAYRVLDPALQPESFDLKSWHVMPGD
jgi:hypothetical protein